MSEQSWVLKGIDPETRQKAEEEAALRGVTLADYLTDIVLQGALAEQLLGAAAPEEDPVEPSAAEITFAPAPQENFAVRHRLEALERRVGLAVGGLDGAVHSLESSVFGLAGRIDEAEILAADTADNLNVAMHETATNLAAMRKRLADAEDHAGALSDAHETLIADFSARCAGIDSRIDTVEDAARAANTSAAQLAVAHEALKYAVADDFSAFARESAARLTAGLDEVRASADAAAEQADAAVAHLIVELRNVRETIEGRLQEGAAETRLKMQAAFADAAERMNSLSDRVTENERLTVRSVEQLRAQLADAEDGAQTALEETAETLRQAGAALAAEFARATQDNRTALESVHGDLSSEIAELRDRQAGGLARLKLVDAAVTNTISEVSTLRETVEQRAASAEAAVRAVLAQSQTDWDQRFGALASRIAAGEREAIESHNTLRAESERVEACTFAALEKLAQDRSQGDAALEARIDDLYARLLGDVGDMRDLNSGALARLKLLDQALGAQNLVAAIEAGAAPLSERLVQIERALSVQGGNLSDRIAHLEAAAESDETAQSLAALSGQVGALADRLDAQQVDDSLMQRVEEIRARLAAYEGQASEAADRVHGVARMLGRLTAQNADASTQSEERLHKLELAIADLRLEHYSGGEAQTTPSVGAEMLRALELRVTEMEERQAEAFEMLRGDISHFIGENARRLEALEQMSPSEPIDFEAVADEFETLRRRIEERILGVEQRSVRALEQVADTMAVLEKRFNAGPDLAARSA